MVDDGGSWSVPEELWTHLKTIYNDAATNEHQLKHGSPAMQYFVGSDKCVPKKPSGTNASADLTCLVETLVVVICNLSGRCSRLEEAVKQCGNADSLTMHDVPSTKQTWPQRRGFYRLPVLNAWTTSAGMCYNFGLSWSTGNRSENLSMDTLTLEDCHG